MGLGLSTGGKEGGKHPERTPGGSTSRALSGPVAACCGLPAPSGRRPAGAPRGEAAVQAGGRKGVDGVRLIPPPPHPLPEMRGGLRGFHGARGGEGRRKAAQGEKSGGGCPRGEPRTSGNALRQQRGQNAHASVARGGRAGGRKEGGGRKGRREGGRTDGRGPPSAPPAAPTPGAAAAGPRRARARARAPVPGPGPAWLLRYLIISTLFLQMFISCFAYHVGAGGPMRAGLARHWRVSLGQVPEIEYLFFQSLGLLKKSH